MDNIHRLFLALAFSAPLVTGAAHANSLLDSVKAPRSNTVNQPVAHRHCRRCHH